MCFTEGFDAPKTAIVSNCRPTKSESLYLQIIGRATRPLAGIVDGPETAEQRKAAIESSEKPYCVILDFCGNSGEHKLVSVADVLAGDSVDPIDLAQAIAIAKEDGEKVDTAELIEKVKQARKEAEDRKEAERIKRLMTSTKADHADYTAVDVNLFAGGKFDSHDNQAEMASDGQKRLLRHLGIDKKQAKHLTKKQASGIIAQEYKKVQKDWKAVMNGAKTQMELHQIGMTIKQRESTDYMLRDKKTLDILRTHYLARREAINGGN
jgi:superfamily II DNA or RNA helicase